MKNLLLNVQHLSIKKQTFIFTPNKYLLFTQFFLSSSHLLTLKSKFETVGWSKGTVFFTYKPSDFFSIWHKCLGDFFTRNGVRLIAEGLGFKKKSTNLPLMQNDHKFCDCSALFFLLLIGEEIQYIVTLIPCKSASHFVSDYKSSDYSGIFYHIV